MSKINKWFSKMLLPLAVFSTTSYAELSATITAASDYLFNGISQTNENPVLQGSIDWSNEHGWYVGSWASNVDFGNDIEAEIDYYTGFSKSLDSNIFYDIGLAHYTYVGGGDSNHINYSEIYVAIGYQSTQLKAWYANDYFGTDARHYILALSHSIKFSEQVALTFQVDRSTSLDDEDFVWDTDDNNYMHAKVETAFSWQSLDFTIGVETTDLDYNDDVKLLGTVSYTFSL